MAGLDLKGNTRGGDILGSVACVELRFFPFVFCRFLFIFIFIFSVHYSTPESPDTVIQRTRRFGYIFIQLWRYLVYTECICNI